MRKPSLAIIVLASVIAALVSCADKPADARYPPRDPGCDVQVFPDTPTMRTDNLGTVNAFCADSLSKEDCMRELKDQTCKLGGDVVWGVSDEPAKIGDKIRYSGRAAHTHVAKVPQAAPSAS